MSTSAHKVYHETHPDAYPSESERLDFLARTEAVKKQSGNPCTLLGEAFQLSEQPMKLAAYRVANGDSDLNAARRVCDTHHMAANGSSMTSSQIGQYLGVLIDAYRQVSTL